MSITIDENTLVLVGLFITAVWIPMGILYDGLKSLREEVREMKDRCTRHFAILEAKE
jgi:hypothetical protein